MSTLLQFIFNYIFLLGLVLTFVTDELELVTTVDGGVGFDGVGFG